MEGIYYQTITGMRQDMTGARSGPAFSDRVHQVSLIALGHCPQIQLACITSSNACRMHELLLLGLAKASFIPATYAGNNTIYSEPSAWPPSISSLKLILKEVISPTTTFKAQVKCQYLRRVKMVFASCRLLKGLVSLRGQQQQACDRLILMGSKKMKTWPSPRKSHTTHHLASTSICPCNHLDFMTG